MEALAIILGAAVVIGSALWLSVKILVVTQLPGWACVKGGRMLQEKYPSEPASSKTVEPR